MRILLITRAEEGPPPPSAMAQALLKLGHSVTVATGRYGDSPMGVGVSWKFRS